MGDQSCNSLDERKKVTSFDVYKEMCELLFKGEGGDYLFANTFFTLECNILACSDNCVAMNAKHVEWRDDCLLLFFDISKGNQTGEKSDNPWYVLSNPESPELCPVLSLEKFQIISWYSSVWPFN